MHSRRSAAVPSLSLVLPHPPLPRRASIVRSSHECNSPRTPRSSGLSSPSMFKLDLAPPRKSTDSWNSSNCDGGDDEMEWEWTTEQMALLGKTLDALPSHLLTPFNGSVPPANVLDKIARSIINAKDPLAWPHSIRSTRLKLHKLARTRAAEQDAQNGRLSGEQSHDVLQPTTNVPKKPLYRQSSMDFLKGNVLRDEACMDRLSARLQRAERVIANPAYHPHMPTSRSPSPHGATRPFSLGDNPYRPITPVDASPRNSIPSISVAAPRPPRLRRSTTTISNLPTIQSGVASTCMSAALPQQKIVNRIRRSESFSSQGMNGLGHSLKRAPSFGTISNRSHDSSRMSVDEQKENAPQDSQQHQEIDIYPSSDEEEKARRRKVKKARTKPGSSPEKSTSSSNSLAVPKVLHTSSFNSSSTISSPQSTIRSKKSTTRTRLTRSSSMFGAELPNPQQQPIPPTCIPIAASSKPSDSSATAAQETPMFSQHKTLRRVKTTNFPPRPSRRISFGSLAVPVEEEGEATGAGLGSAFQMH